MSSFETSDLNEKREYFYELSSLMSNDLGKILFIEAKALIGHFI
ncbi:hypothetical protein HMPREF1872_00007 [Amygdalobacter nucleatus]|uniref:Uncharacterized protein n=1 Tax=Amygdalobacter nucleatus TaxID=3029274 RepID=A0A133YHK5_9FIRM|nr:hypothetical protein HMPREF1872_00007 [Amygdalobacter nucleatus]